MTHIAPLFATLFANHLNATLHAPNPKMPFAMSNAKNLNVKSNVPIKVAKCLTAQNVLQYAKLLTVLLTVKLLNLNARLYVKNQNVTGNAINLNAPSPNAS